MLIFLACLLLGCAQNDTGSEKDRPGGFYGGVLKPLSDPALTSALFNVVVFDSPVNLPVGTLYPSSRASADHLMRIDSVVRYYKNKFNLPIWLMGHSNGVPSIVDSPTP